MRKIIILLPFLALVACGDGSGKPASKVEYSFTPVQMPVTITDSASQVAWMAINYWGNTPVGDTAILRSAAVEQAFVNWLNLLNYAGADVAGRAIASFMSRNDSLADARQASNHFLERYLYDANSPMRNEDMYIMVLQYMIGSPYLSQDEKIRPRAHLEMALKNRVGTLATNFSYTTTTGVKGSLYAVKAPYTLIFFNNPDCTACKEITTAMSSSGAITAMIKSGKLKVLAMYTDSDLAAWKKYAPNIPSDWINAENYDLHSSKEYDLKAIPTLYLLDKDKRVLLKDVDFRQLIYHLESL